MKRYILTGTPGSGKTSILSALSALGYSTVNEAATDVIADEQKLGDLKPWEHPEFIDKIIHLQKMRQEEGNSTTIQFYDRPPICTYALAVYLGFEPSPILMDEIERAQSNAIYENQVFFIENLGFIENTDARKISFEEALRFEQVHMDAYKKFGYEIIKIPANTIDARVKLILDTTD